MVLRHRAAGAGATTRPADPRGARRLGRRPRHPRRHRFDRDGRPEGRGPARAVVARAVLAVPGHRCPEHPRVRVAVPRPSWASRRASGELRCAGLDRDREHGREPPSHVRRPRITDGRTAPGAGPRGVRCRARNDCRFAGSPPSPLDQPARLGRAHGAPYCEPPHDIGQVPRVQDVDLPHPPHVHPRRSARDRSGRG